MPRRAIGWRAVHSLELSAAPAVNEGGWLKFLMSARERLPEPEQFVPRAGSSWLRTCSSVRAALPKTLAAISATESPGLTSECMNNCPLARLCAIRILKSAKP